MKIVIFHSGLGNQLFHFCYYLYLEKKYGKCIYGAFMGNEHNGYELEKIVLPFIFEGVIISLLSVITGIGIWRIRIITKKL